MNAIGRATEVQNRLDRSKFIEQEDKKRREYNLKVQENRLLERKVKDMQHESQQDKEQLQKKNDLIEQLSKKIAHLETCLRSDGVLCLTAAVISLYFTCY